MLNQSLIAGILLILVSFSGFPSGWKDLAYVAIGLVLIVWALMKKNHFFGFFAPKSQAMQKEIPPTQGL